jgi:hypothetical protein
MQLWHWVPRNSIFSIFFTWCGALFVQSSRLRSPQTQDNTTSPLQSPLSALAADRMGREDAASAAHASRTPPGTERGCGASTAEVPNTAADAAASAPPSPPSAPNSENCSLLSCLVSRDLYRVVFASEGCKACLIVRSPPQVKNGTQCHTCIYY